MGRMIGLVASPEKDDDDGTASTGFRRYRFEQIEWAPPSIFSLSLPDLVGFCASGSLQESKKSSRREMIAIAVDFKREIQASISYL